MFKGHFVFKYINNLLPSHFNIIMPDRVSEISSYNLRNSLDLVIPHTTKNYFLKSFIPSSITAQNKIDNAIKNIANLDEFKKALKEKYETPFYHMRLYGDGNGALNHSRIRMGLSGLNSHRRKYNFINNSSCGMCGDKSETALHYFTKCPSYAAQRNILLQEMQAVAPPELHIDILNFDQPRSAKRLVDVLIDGTGNHKIDKTLFDSAHKFIFETKRFLQVLFHNNCLLSFICKLTSHVCITFYFILFYFTHPILFCINYFLCSSEYCHVIIIFVSLHCRRDCLVHLCVCKIVAK